MQTTFAIIKPDAVKAGYTGKIIQRIEEAGFRILALQLRQLSVRDAEGVYAVHRERLPRHSVHIPELAEAVIFPAASPDQATRFSVGCPILNSRFPIPTNDHSSRPVDHADGARASHDRAL